MTVRRAKRSSMVRSVLTCCGDPTRVRGISVCLRVATGARRRMKRLYLQGRHTLAASSAGAISGRGGRTGRPGWLACSETERSHIRA